jgi:hypothetical protein
MEAGFPVFAVKSGNIMQAKNIKPRMPRFPCGSERRCGGGMQEDMKIEERESGRGERI